MLQLFFIGDAVPTMIWLGADFARVDLRLCNAYSLESQVLAGQGLAAMASTLGMQWLVTMLRRGRGTTKTAPVSPCTQSPPPQGI